jgi:hypothetical protein
MSIQGHFPTVLLTLLSGILKYLLAVSVHKQHHSSISKQMDVKIVLAIQPGIPLVILVVQPLQLPPE